jgi:hypothetical protein|tara:strand:- start:656 stop:1693 length:1038 start_codon:yes stop_codon:yes gene_type:complete
MSDQSAEESIQTEFTPNSEGKLEPQTMEDKFFGVKTEIKKTDDSDLKVEVVDEDAVIPEPKQTAEKPVDDETLDKEISDYSERAGKRINQIKYEYHEERRAKESALKEKEEAIKQLKTLMHDNQRLQQIVAEGGKVVNEQAKNNAQFAKLSAQAKYKRAYDEGDAEAMAQAQAELTKATLAEQQAPNYATAMQQQIVANMPQQAVQQPTPDPDMQAWAQKNPWFMSQDPAHKEMTSFAMFLDQKLQASGVDPATQSQKYYAEIDAGMRSQYPNFFGVTQASVETTPELPIEEKRQPANVVAPASRNSGSNKNPRNVRLTQTQVKLARQLGISPEQYARQLLKDSV